MSILFAILIFSILILVHELGHFAAAKISGVRVNEFSMFMGPAIWKKQIGETMYSLRCIPIGGFCAMEGEDGDSEDPRSLQKALWWKRLIILVSGAAMNFIIGVLVTILVYLPAQQFVVPVIGYFEPGCVLQSEDGLQLGDRFLEIDGEKIYVYSDFTTILNLNPGNNIHDILLERNGEKVFMEDFPLVKSEFSNEDGTTTLRYGFSFSVEDATFTSKIRHAWDSAMDMVRMVRLSLQMLVQGQAKLADVGGPVMIVDQMNQVAQGSETKLDAILNMCSFGGFISLNLAVMNMLPLPALDGGRVVGVLLTTGIEAITRKKINPKYEGYIHGAGMIVLLALMALIMFKDIIFLFKR